jgi:flagellar motor switch protein FliG
MSSNINLTTEEKVAILLISLEKEHSIEILRNLSEKDLQKVAYHIAESRVVPQTVRSEVLQEFYQLCLSEGYVGGSGGLEYAKEVLTEALGAQRSMEILGKMSAMRRTKPFGFLSNIDDNEVAYFLKAERNQTVALILSFMDTEQSSNILSTFEEDRQADIITRVAKMSRISPDIVKQVESEVKKRIDNILGPSDATDIVGLNIAAEMLSSMDRVAKVKVLNDIEYTNAELAEELRKRMFLFEDIMTLDQRYVQTILTRADNADIAMALKSTAEGVKEFVYANVSERAREMVEQEMDMLGRVRLSEVLEAQQKIVAIVLEMERNQELVITKDGDDELVE